MPRPKHAEVFSIERCQLWFAKPFGNGQDRRIDQPDVSIGVLVAELSDAPIILDRKVLNAVCTRVDVVQQCDENPRMQALVNPVVHLNQDECWDDERFGGSLYQPSAPAIRSIIPIE
jgi:hypothetical protein